MRWQRGHVLTSDSKRVKVDGGERVVARPRAAEMSELEVRRRVCLIARQHNMFVTTEFCELLTLALTERLLGCAEKLTAMAKHRRQRLDKEKEEENGKGEGGSMEVDDPMEIVRKLQEEAACRGKITGRDGHLLVESDWNLSCASRPTARFHALLEKP